MTLFYFAFIFPVNLTPRLENRSLARGLHYCFLGSGSPKAVQTAKGGIETRQFLGYAVYSA